MSCRLNAFSQTDIEPRPCKTVSQNTASAALHDSRDGNFFALFQFFERERQRSVHYTTYTQSPVRIEEQFCWRRAEVAADKEAGIRREGGGELLPRGFSIQRSRHVHDEAVASCFETSRSSACTLGVTWLSACGTPSPWMTLSSKIRRDRDRDAGSSFTIASPHGDEN